MVDLHNESIFDKLFDKYNIRKTLNENYIYSLNDLLMVDPSELIKIKGIGRKKYHHIRTVLLNFLKTEMIDKWCGILNHALTPNWINQDYQTSTLAQTQKDQN